LYWPLSKTGMARLCSCVARVGENFLLIFSRKQTGGEKHIGHKIPFLMKMTEAELHGGTDSQAVANFTPFFHCFRTENASTNGLIAHFSACGVLTSCVG
jgi:hypothetical protein